MQELWSVATLRPHIWERDTKTNGIKNFFHPREREKPKKVGCRCIAMRGCDDARPPPSCPPAWGSSAPACMRADSIRSPA